MKKIYFSIFLVYINFLVAISQTTPAPKQQGEIVITGANIHVGNGQLISNGILAFTNGKISYVGSDISKVSANARRIDAKDKEIYPGFIALGSSLGLNEIEQVKATIDESELGAMNANVRSIIAYNTDSRVQNTLRTNGVLMAEIAPKGAVISGQSSFVQLDAWNWEDASLYSDIAIHLTWPSPYRYSGWWAEPGSSSTNDKYEKDVARIKNFFDEAFAYSKNPPAMDKNLRYEAMLDIWSGKKKLIIHASLAKAIISAIGFAKNYGITPIIAEAEDAWRICDFIKENKVSILLGESHNLPLREDDDTDQIYKNAKLLYDAGILYAMKVNGFWQQRNLPFQVGQTVAYGVPKEAAIASITANVAKIFDLNAIGTLEVNKDATFFVSSGDAMDMIGNQVELAFIQGREIDLNNHQKALYRKYHEKYRIQN
ncbi:MAG TPA: amidohydrolase [Saprospiraceae bacterium]|jgi:imidazolonepropionase-like amidohydrolase|nr:amidohydrolase [Saprospiraceae bacterium]